eukprot:TRINITY_DN18258_c0_g1_i1.p1 TRINITY_DN18258_c0_g1~~TRINITY_DN18258_c0_g1_i1.p1  ORF type:complete len:110 (+),score=11.03 TRINITY_DN18258_c0_g1_i1:405-734(+)
MLDQRYFDVQTYSAGRSMDNPIYDASGNNRKPTEYLDVEQHQEAGLADWKPDYDPGYLCVANDEMHRGSYGRVVLGYQATKITPGMQQTFKFAPAVQCLYSSDICPNSK